MSALTRRQFTRSLLAGAAATGGGLLLGRSAAAEPTIVVGGGPAGAAAALALRRARPGVPVLLIERDPGGLAGAAPKGSDAPFAKPAPRLDAARLREAGVDIALDEVVGVDWRAGRLDLFSGRRIGFGRLVLAPGAAPCDEAIPGLDARARHLWPAAWGGVREARRLAAALDALPARGHVALRLPPGPISHPEVALRRAVDLADFLARRRPHGRLTVLDGGPNPEVEAGFHRLFARGGPRVDVDWRTASRGGTVLAVDAERGALETDAGRIRADVVNFAPLQGAGRIARVAGLVDASGWCPCDAGGRSEIRSDVLILGDARKHARRTEASAVGSIAGAAL
ncbi:MAG: FAD-dependent oxidoreductase [Rubrimonas sp.]